MKVWRQTASYFDLGLVAKFGVEANFSSRNLFQRAWAAAGPPTVCTAGTLWSIGSTARAAGSHDNNSGEAAGQRRVIVVAKASRRGKSTRAKGSDLGASSKCSRRVRMKKTPECIGRRKRLIGCSKGQQSVPVDLLDADGDVGVHRSQGGQRNRIIIRHDHASLGADGWKELYGTRPVSARRRDSTGPGRFPTAWRSLACLARTKRWWRSESHRPPQARISAITRGRFNSLAQPTARCRAKFHLARRVAVIQ